MVEEFGLEEVRFGDVAEGAVSKRRDYFCDVSTGADVIEPVSVWGSLEGIGIFEEFFKISNI